MADARPLPRHVLDAAARSDATLEGFARLGAAARKYVDERVFEIPVQGARPRGRSKLQASYAEDLELRRRAGELVWVLEEAVSLRLAMRTWCRPDFLVLRADGRLEIHEVKGHWEDDARAKLKIAAELHAWARFLAITRRAGAWSVEELPGPRRLC